MAREGREAARPSGMRAGDWQAERQLQEALRESRQVRLLHVRVFAYVSRSYGMIVYAVLALVCFWLPMYFIDEFVAGDQCG